MKSIEKHILKRYGKDEVVKGLLTTKCKNNEYIKKYEKDISFKDIADHINYGHKQRGIEEVKNKKNK